MKFDRNTVIGFLVMAVLLIGYIVFNNKERSAFEKEKQIKDSADRANYQPKIKDTAAYVKDSIHKDSVRNQAKAGNFHSGVNGTEQIVYVQNEVLTIALSNLGGQPKWVELKKFKNMDSGRVRLAANQFDKISYTVLTGQQSTEESAKFYFQKIDSVKHADNSTTVSFTLQADSGSTNTIVHKYTIRPNDYMVDFDVELTGADKMLTNNTMNFTWKYTAAQQESSLSFEQQNTQVGYIEDGDFDYHTIGKTSSVKFDAPVQWLGVRQRFFNTFLVSKDNFSSGEMSWNIGTPEQKVVMQATSNMQVKLKQQPNVTAGFQLFYGPADYHTLTKYNMGFGNIINLGQGPYAFVSPLNKYVVLPVWDFIKGFVSNFGLVIALLTLFIRLLISPLTYKSYLSGAKMKALRPEIAKLKEKYGGDQQQISMEQMKLFREAGVSPLGGCIPALLQIPIFFALYSFFNSSVDLRGTDFLWAKDLSAYDQIVTWGDVPVVTFLLGHHLSLFTITAVLTSFLISLYSMSLAPDQSNPVMKYMPYIFPVFLLFIFNGLPSALTWYYTVSNIITLILQFVIQNYIIDHDKILANIQQNRKKPKAKSKWQERLEQMQEQQKKLKDTQKGQQKAKK
jgi:YidC/Oxa1 family membrane protein insertase